MRGRSGIGEQEHRSGCGRRCGAGRELMGDIIVRRGAAPPRSAFVQSACRAGGATNSEPRFSVFIGRMCCGQNTATQIRNTLGMFM